MYLTFPKYKKKTPQTISHETRTNLIPLTKITQEIRVYTNYTKMKLKQWKGRKSVSFLPFPPHSLKGADDRTTQRDRQTDGGWMDMTEEMFQHLGNSLSFFFSLLLPDVHPSQQDVGVLDERSAQIITSYDLDCSSYPSTTGQLARNLTSVRNVPAALRAVRHSFVSLGSE